MTLIIDKGCVIDLMNLMTLVNKVIDTWQLEEEEEEEKSGWTTRKGGTKMKELEACHFKNFKLKILCKQFLTRILFWTTLLPNPSTFKSQVANYILRVSLFKVSTLEAIFTPNLYFICVLIEIVLNKKNLIPYNIYLNFCWKEYSDLVSDNILRKIISK